MTDDEARKSPGRRQPTEGRGNHLRAGADTDRTDSDWSVLGLIQIRHLADRGEPFSSFDLTEAGLPNPENPAKWGALFREAHKDGVIVPVGYLQSRRPSRHRSIVRLWVGSKAA